MHTNKFNGLMKYYDLNCRIAALHGTHDKSCSQGPAAT